MAAEVISYLAPTLSRFIAPDWTIYRNVPYGFDAQQTGDLYLLNSGERPLVILIHGGGWSSGDKEAYAGRARKFALAGFHVFAINYRLASFGDKSTQWPAQIEDVRKALVWAREGSFTLRIDQSRICVAGDSAGGHLALMTGTGADKPSCIINVYGPCDLRHMSDLICALPVFGGGPATADACPIDYIGYGFPPTLIIHGKKDETVAYSQAVTLADRLKSLGVEHSLISYNGGHELTGWRQYWLELRSIWWAIRRLG